jgi:GTP-binding protein
MEAEFIISAARPEQFPTGDAPEVAFLGRSNVGKSTLINSLLGAKGLARISARPGSTQAINFYRVDGDVHFVDFPGYGYARTAPAEQRRWRFLIESYLRERPNLELCLLLIDARRGWMEMDLDLKQWLEAHRRRYLVVVSKFDKLKNQRERQQGLTAVHHGPGALSPVAFSAVSGQGVKQIWQVIRNISSTARNPNP